jgi:solute carrier family 39 (zinc transporter), member 7
MITETHRFSHTPKMFAAAEVLASTAAAMGTGSGGGYERWKSALLSTLFISTLPNILLYLIPSKWLKRGKNDTLNIQHVLLCFAAGGLLGDVLLHSIPHLLSPHKHHEHERMEVLDTLHEEHDHDHHDHDHEHHDHQEESHQSPRILQEEHHEDHEHHHEHLLHIGLLVIVGYMIFFVSERLLSQQFSNDPEKKKNDDHHSHAHSHSPTSNISVMGWLNIFADVMHNFTDGIAMGASYASGSSSHALGLAATISILFHEIPHEIGDFTILIESGVRSALSLLLHFSSDPSYLPPLPISALPQQITSHSNAILHFHRSIPRHHRGSPHGWCRGLE